MTTVIEQSPNEILDWTIDWTQSALGTDTISSSSWSVSSPDVTLSDASHTNTTATIWVTGGNPGSIYQITNTIVTAGERTMQATAPYVCIYQRQA